jgi:hypothetical protein
MYNIQNDFTINQYPSNLMVIGVGETKINANGIDLTSRRGQSEPQRKKIKLIFK